MVRGSSEKGHVQILAALEIVNGNSDVLTPDEITVLEDRRTKIAQLVFQEIINAADRVIERQR